MNTAATKVHSRILKNFFIIIMVVGLYLGNGYGHGAICR